jgi:hypothetical protein
MQADLLVQILNAMPPEQLGQLIARINNPQAYLNNTPQGAGYRGNLPVQMSIMQGSMGPGGQSPLRRG